MEPLLSAKENFVRQGAVIALSFILIQQTEAGCPKVAEFRKTVTKMIVEKGEDILTKVTFQKSHYLSSDFFSLEQFWRKAFWTQEAETSQFHCTIALDILICLLSLVPLSFCSTGTGTVLRTLLHWLSARLA